MPSQTRSTGSKISAQYRRMRQVLFPFFNRREMNETADQKCLLIASSTSEKVNEILDIAADDYPFDRFHFLADERNGKSLKMKFPEGHIREYRLDLSRKEKLSLIASLQDEQYDYCMLLLTDEEHYDFIKAAGFLCGAKTIEAYYEPRAKFYNLAKHRWMLLRYYLTGILNRPINFYLLFPFFKPFGAVIGFAVAFIRALPMLISAKRLEGSPNPFIDHPFLD